MDSPTYVFFDVFKADGAAVLEHDVISFPANVNAVDATHTTGTHTQSLRTKKYTNHHCKATQADEFVPLWVLQCNAIQPKSAN